MSTLQNNTAIQDTAYSVLLYAQPYDCSAEGFYFSSCQEFMAKSLGRRNVYGDPVEEYEMQFIDGDDLDCLLFDALGIHQGTASQYIDLCESWDELEKITVIIACQEVGYSFDIGNSQPRDFELELYEMDSLKDLAYQFVDEGLFGSIPDSIQPYLDFDAIARDLGMDYSEVSLAGRRYVYRMA